MSPPGLALLGGLLLFAVAGGLLALDRRAAFQAMLSQPVVSVSLLGLLCDLPELGFDLAVRLQLLWMASMLFGASTPPNEHVASLVTAGAALLGTLWLSADKGEAEKELVLALALLTGSPFAWLGRHLDMRLDRSHLRLAQLADEAAARGDLRALSRVPLRGLWRVFLANTAVVALGCLVTVPVVRILATTLGGATATALMAFASFAVPALGVAVSLSLVKRRRAILLGTSTFVLTLLTLPAGALRP